MIHRSEILIAGVIAVCLFGKRLPEMVEEFGHSIELFRLRYHDPVQWHRCMARLQLLCKDRTRQSIEDLKRLVFVLAVFLLPLELAELCRG